jgi:hypothetical protein
MTGLLEKAIAVIRELPEARQDEIANLLLFEAGEKTLSLTAEENRAVDEGLADAAAGRFATPEAISRIFGRGN